MAALNKKLYTYDTQTGALVFDTSIPEPPLELDAQHLKNYKYYMASGSDEAAFSYAMKYGKKEGQMKDHPAVVEARSQKVKGLRVMQEVGAYGGDLLMIKGVVQTLDQIEKYANYISSALPSFARPCPVRPRHGFVDSRVVTSVKQLISLLKETHEADPEGEVMLTPVYEKVYLNSIVTPGAIVIGEGHDGATAGRNTLTIPLAGVMCNDIEKVLEKGGINKEKDDPYVEVIYVPSGGYGGVESLLHSRYIITQMRGGPKGAGIGDYIPAETVVKSVIKPNDMSLLSWENLLKNAPEGTVIYHPGGAPTDHYAAHARTFKVPVLFSREPVVGETLVAAPPPPYNPVEYLKGARTAWNIPLERHSHDAASLMILGAHHMGAMTGESSFWVGLSVGLMLRLGIAAMFGEARHCNAWVTQLTSNRAQNWSDSWKTPIDSIPSSLLELTQVHEYGPWQSRGYGGRKWAQCGIALFPLVRDLRLLALMSPDNPRVFDCMDRLNRSLNIAINQAHNGGWWMNKFIGQETFTYLQKGQVGYLAKCAPLAWKTYTSYMASESDARKAFGSWRIKHMTAVDLEQASLAFIPGVNKFILQLKSPEFSAPKLIPIRISRRMIGKVVQEGCYLKKVVGRWTMFAPDGKRIWIEPALRPQSTPTAE